MQQQCSLRPSRVSPYLTALINARFSMGLINIQQSQPDVKMAGVMYIKNNRNYPGNPISTSHTSIGDYALPLATHQQVTKINTATSVIRACFNQYPHFCTFRDKKGNFYYARDGIILDKNKKPILLVVYTFANGPAVHFQVLVPPRIFFSTGLIEKYIVKALLPHFCKIKTVPFNGDNASITVGITDAIDDYIIATHYTNSHYQKEINELLKENSSTIADDLWNP